MHDFKLVQPPRERGTNCFFKSLSTRWWWFSHLIVSDSRDPMDYNLPGSSVHGILQAKILEWVAISFSRGSSQPGNWTRVSHIVGRFFTNWATREAPQLDMPPEKAVYQFYVPTAVAKNPLASAGDTGSIPGSGRSPGNGNPLQYSRLENSMDRGAWQLQLGLQSMGLQSAGHDWVHIHRHAHTHTFGTYGESSMCILLKTEHTSHSLASRVKEVCTKCKACSLCVG